MKLIKFICMDLEYPFGEPILAKTSVPQWYKDGETFYYSDGKEEKTAGLKTCIPFLDAITSGYLLVTPFDIFIGHENDDKEKLSIKWNGPQSWDTFVMERPKESGSTIPRPAGHLSNHFVWSSRWGWKSPRGYSTFVTHPLNRYDLPFTTMSGFMDSDKAIINGNIPFFLKEGFTGVIPAGTPIAQVIPVKRKSWQVIIDKLGASSSKMQSNEIAGEKAYYKKHLWVRKEYS